MRCVAIGLGVWAEEEQFRQGRTDRRTRQGNERTHYSRGRLFYKERVQDTRGFKLCRDKFDAIIQDVGDGLGELPLSEDLMAQLQPGGCP